MKSAELKIKNDPYAFLEREGVAKSLLSDASKEALQIYDESLEGLNEYPKDKGLRNMAEQIGKAALDVLEQDITQLQKTQIKKAEDKETTKKKELQSREILEKSVKAIDYLSECRLKLRQERQRKIESGEIKPPVKKQLTTKLKELFQKIPGLMPTKVKEDKDKIEQTEKAVKKFLCELKKIWGLNRIQQMQQEIEDKFEKLKDKAEMENA
jgi:hypothetical protein